MGMTPLQRKAGLSAKGETSDNIRGLCKRAKNVTAQKLARFLSSIA